MFLSQPDFVPACYRDDPRIQGQLYFLIPQSLWHAVTTEVGTDRFASADHQRETAIAAALRQGQIGVGFWNRQQIVFPRLLDFQPLPSVEQIQQAEGLRDDHGVRLERALQKLSQRSQSLAKASQGYLGWLLTTLQFLKEQEELICNHREAIAADGFPQPLRGAHPFALTATVGIPPWIVAVKELSARWRIHFFAAPDCPWLLELQLPQLGPGTPSAESNVFQLFLPDIHPLKGTGLLTELLEENRQRGEEVCHLQEWLDIISSANPAKNQIDRFARIFPLQHFWRVFQQRYPKELTRSTERLRRGFATYFGVSEDTIKSDLRLIRQRLANGWEQRPFWP